ncbi:hypothetical protein ACLBYG_22635 [Methylobacterium sp. D53M]
MSEKPVPEFLRQTMVDRVSKAIVAHLAENGRSVFWEELPPIWREIYRDLARAVISAMREPNLAMRRVCSFPTAEIVWPAMIDAALSSPAPTEEG